MKFESVVLSAKVKYNARQFDFSNLIESSLKKNKKKEEEKNTQTENSIKIA